MRIQTDEDDMNESKTMKVQIPTRLHLKLHSLKILSGRTISDTVEEAVETYFEANEDVPEGLTD
jgi:predicted DNA-binding protein